MRYILVPATGADTDAAVFAMALTTARKLSAHLEFLHVGMDVRETLAAMATADMAGGGGYGLVLDELEQEVSRRQRKAEQAFHDFCEGEGLVVSADPSTPAPTAEWRRETGDEPAWIATHGHAADLLVLGRASDGEAIDLLEAALMTSGRPVLIAPAKPPADLGRVVAIAWKDRPEAARAVTAAQPFLRRGRPAGLEFGHADVVSAAGPVVRCARPARRRGGQARSKRSRFMTLSHAATKSRTNFSLASSAA